MISSFRHLYEIASTLLSTPRSRELSTYHSYSHSTVRWLQCTIQLAWVCETRRREIRPGPAVLCLARTFPRGEPTAPKSCRVSPARLPSTLAARMHDTLGTSSEPADTDCPNPPKAMMALTATPHSIYLGIPYSLWQFGKLTSAELEWGSFFG